MKIAGSQFGLQTVWLVIPILMVSCFQIRPVEPPGTNTSDWISPTDYQILLGNFSTSIAKGNTQNYLRCFNQDSLDFNPAASLINDNESIWLNWSIQDEQSYFDNMLANLSVNTGNSLVLVETDLQNVTSDSLKYVGDYTLRINHQDTLLATLFKGQIQLLIRLNSFNEWEIYRWEDIETKIDSSWSELKLKYVQ